jgi:hypothetical protein
MQDTASPRRFGLSGTALKYLAAALMVFDHLHQFFTAQGAPLWFNMLGRPVLPVFLFMAAEGFHYTRSRKRYMLQLLIGFLAMNLLNLALTTVLPLSNLPDETAPALMNNVFGTLLMTAFCCFAITHIQEGVRRQKVRLFAAGVLLLLAPVAATAAVLVLLTNATNEAAFLLASFVPNLLTVEGGWAMVLMGVLFFLLRRVRWAQMLVIAAFALLSFLSGQGGNIQWMMVFAIPLLLLYNGQRGRGGRFDKYFFYLFYPAHIYLLYGIAWFLQR